MSYILKWKNPALPGKTDINVPIGAVVSDKASLRFTGKGAPNYGAIQQENLMRLLESFADPAPPTYPTIGQEWFDTLSGNLKVCTSISPVRWKALGGIQVTTEQDGNVPPSNSQSGASAIGDMWFQRTGPGTGFLFVYTGYGRHPENFPSIGGWNQIWPTVETIAGREEYDSVAALVNQLMGDPALGGSGALGKNLALLPDLATLDADLLGKFNSNPDARFVYPTNGDKSELKIDVTSQDWDLLLATAKYAVARLDLPPTMVDDISPVPFVSDGRPAPTSLLSLPTSSVRYPSLERRSNRRFGIVTLVRCFAETVNVLNTAIVNRYALKGINGITGTNPNFDANVITSTHKQFSGVTGGAPGGSVTVAFNFANPDALTSFLTSGGAVQLTFGYTPSGAAPPTPPAAGQPETVTQIFNTPGAKSWTAPVGVTALTTISGYGAAGDSGDSQTYWQTEYVTTYWWRDQSVVAPNNPNNDVTQVVRSRSATKNYSTPPTATCGAIVPLSTSDSANYYQRQQCLEYPTTTTTTSATTGASIVAFGRTFPGKTGSGTVPTTTFSNVAVVAGQTYNFTVPSGGSLTFTYTQPAATTGGGSTGGGGGTSITADAELKNLFDQRGILRFTADKTRVFANVFPPSTISSPLFQGLKDAPSTGRILTTQTVAGASYTATVSQSSPTQLRLTAAFSGPGPLNGTVTVKFEVIRDTTTYMVGSTPTQVFGAPQAFAVGDKVEGSAFLN